MTGRFYYSSRSKSQSESIGIKDVHTDKVLIVVDMLFREAGESSEGLQKHKDKNATIWYSTMPNGWLLAYQLEVEGKIIFSLEKSNNRTHFWTEYRKENGKTYHYLMLAVLILLPMFGGWAIARMQYVKEVSTLERS